MAPVSDGRCSTLNFVVSSQRLEKRSQALRGRNLARNIQTDGAPMVHHVPGNYGCQGPFCLAPSDTGAMPPKIHQAPTHALPTPRKGQIHPLRNAMILIWKVTRELPSLPIRSLPSVWWLDLTF
jgi:hypothetical protein